MSEGDNWGLHPRRSISVIMSRMKLCYLRIDLRVGDRQTQCLEKLQSAQIPSSKILTQVSPDISNTNHITPSDKNIIKIHGKESTPGKSR